MPHIAGILETAPAANQVIADLLSIGLQKDDLSLIVSDKAKAHFSAATKDTGDRAIVDSAIGASTGGILGALLLGLTAVGGVVIPGASLLVAGPLVAALTGAGTGAAIGGLAGALSAYGISAVESQRYEKEISAGKAVIVAHTKDDKQTMAVRGVLMNSGAEIRAA